LPLPAAFAITASVLKTQLNLSLPSRESGFSFLVRNFAAQDDRFRGAFGIIENAITARAFPACSLAVTFRGELVATKPSGTSPTIRLRPKSLSQAYSISLRSPKSWPRLR
jgi:hypothetical protein